MNIPLTDEIIINTIKSSVRHSYFDCITTFTFFGIIGLVLLFYVGKDFVSVKICNRNGKGSNSSAQYLVWFCIIAFFLFLAGDAWRSFVHLDENADYYVLETTIEKIGSDGDGDYYASFDGVKGGVSASREQYKSMNPGSKVFVAVDKETGRTWAECFWSTCNRKYVGNRPFVSN